MRFKRHKPKAQKDLDRWNLPKRVKVALAPIPEEPRGGARTKRKTCRKTKKAHCYKHIGSKLTLYTFSDRKVYSDYAQNIYQCVDCGHKKVKDFFRVNL